MLLKYFRLLLNRELKMLLYYLDVDVVLTVLDGVDVCIEDGALTGTS